MVTTRVTESPGLCRARRGPLLALGAVSVALTAGCAGSARLDMIPLGFKQIDASAPLLITLRADECYFWINDSRQIQIAFTGMAWPLLGTQAGTSFDVSLVLDGVPANRARDYRATRRTLRGYASGQGQHTRFASVRGIVAVWIDGPDQLRGRFRISTKFQKFNILRGWHANQEVLMLGDLTADRDRRKCHAILARTEEAGMERDPTEPRLPEPQPITGPPVSGPATHPNPPRQPASSGRSGGPELPRPPDSVMHRNREGFLMLRPICQAPWCYRFDIAASSLSSFVSRPVFSTFSALS